MSRFARACGTYIPDWMEAAFGNAQDEEQHNLLATAIATELCDKLIEEGGGHLHFYTLNKPDLTYNVSRAIGCEAAPLEMAAGGVA